MISSMRNKKGSGRAAPLGAGRSGERLFGGFRRLTVGWARLHRNEGSPANPLLELDRTLFEREQRVVAPHAAGMDLGPACPRDELPGNAIPAADFLAADPAPGAAAAVARGAACLLMPHLNPPAPPALAPPACPVLDRRRTIRPGRGSRRSAARSRTGGGRSCRGGVFAPPFFERFNVSDS